MQAVNETVHHAPLLRMKGIEKSFPGVRALHNVDLEVAAGEVVALLGENGAGKSTLIKMLGGAHQPDQGTIEFAGQDVQLANPSTAAKLGIGVIYQEFNLVPELSPWENIFLGRETTRFWIPRQQERQLAAQWFEQLGAEIPLDQPCSQLSIAQQQIVEIVKTLARDARLIVMDEPSAALTGQEVARLFDVIRDLRKRGIGVIYVSHRLDEIFEICNRVIVLRDGERVAQTATSAVTRQRLIELMVGRDIEDEFPKQSHSIGPVRLSAHGIGRGERVRQVSFELRAGEVVGLTGLVGSGRTEVARLLFAADPLEQGEIKVDGKAVRFRSPADAIRAGIGLLTEDRKQSGLILAASVRENFGLPNLQRLSRWGWVLGKRETQDLASFITRLQIKLSHVDQPAGNLSGGNQQKVVLAKWLERQSEIVIFDEPTRGIDVGAKYEIYQLINELARQGKAILMISSELPEILGMSDRILVMHEGRMVGEITDVAAATQEQILEMAVTSNS